MARKKAARRKKKGSDSSSSSGSDDDETFRCSVKLTQSGVGAKENLRPREISETVDFRLPLTALSVLSGFFLIPERLVEDLCDNNKFSCDVNDLFYSDEVIDFINRFLNSMEFMDLLSQLFSGFSECQLFNGFNECYAEIRECSGMGRGMFAIKDIPIEAVIMTYASFCFITSNKRFFKRLPSDRTAGINFFVFGNRKGIKQPEIGVFFSKTDLERKYGRAIYQADGIAVGFTEPFGLNVDEACKYMDAATFESLRKNMLDASQMAGCFANSSCKFNCQFFLFYVVVPYGDRLFVFTLPAVEALRDIKAGEHLTLEYGNCFNFPSNFLKLPLAVQDDVLKAGSKAEARQIIGDSCKDFKEGVDSVAGFSVREMQSLKPCMCREMCIILAKLNLVPSLFRCFANLLKDHKMFEIFGLNAEAFTCSSLASRRLDGTINSSTDFSRISNAQSNSLTGSQLCLDQSSNGTIKSSIDFDGESSDDSGGVASSPSVLGQSSSHESSGTVESSMNNSGKSFDAPGASASSPSGLDQNSSGTIKSSFDFERNSSVHSDDDSETLSADLAEQSVEQSQTEQEEPQTEQPVMEANPVESYQGFVQEEGDDFHGDHGDCRPLCCMPKKAMNFGKFGSFESALRYFEDPEKKKIMERERKLTLQRARTLAKRNEQVDKSRPLLYSQVISSGIVQAPYVPNLPPVMENRVASNFNDVRRCIASASSDKQASTPPVNPRAAFYLADVDHCRESHRQDNSFRAFEPSSPFNYTPSMSLPGSDLSPISTAPVIDGVDQSFRHLELLNSPGKSSPIDWYDGTISHTLTDAESRYFRTDSPSDVAYSPSTPSDQ